MKNDICMKCDGRGFHWVKGDIIDRAGNSIATTNKAGPICEACNGSGSHKRASRPVGCGNYVFMALMLFLFFAFVANPVAHAISG